MYKRHVDGSTEEKVEVLSSSSHGVLTSSQYETEINNLGPGKNPEEFDIEYYLKVEYGPDGEQTYTSEHRRYTFKNTDEELLYIPIKAQESTQPDASVDDINESALKTNRYFHLESRGDASLRHETLRADTSDGYHVLPDEPINYLKFDAEEDKETSTFTQNGSEVEVIEIDYSYDRRAILCDAAPMITDEYDVNFGDYEAIVWSRSKFPGSGTRTYWTTENETLTLPNGTVVEGNGSRYLVDETRRSGRAYASGPYADWNCPGRLIGDGNRHVQIGASNSDGAPEKYGTYAHELGHAVFGWDDYYGVTKNEEGIVGLYGLMGSGNYRSEHPSQVMAYHKLKEGWVPGKTLDDANLNEGESEQTFLPYAADRDTVSPDHRALKYDGSNWIDLSIFDTYYVEARDLPNEALPEQESLRETEGGLLVYGADDNVVNLVQSTEETGIEGWAQKATISPNNYNTAVYDPDLGVEIGLTEDPRAPDDGLSVNVSKVQSENYQGVNVYTRVDCENITGNVNSALNACGSVKDQNSPKNFTAPRVGVLAHTEAGTVGVTANGTVVNEVPGGTVIDAGTMKKVYLPRNYSARYEVNASAVPEAANVSLTTQTVTRDENGTRVASAVDNETVAGNRSVTPETARLSVTPDEWDAGRHRTLGSNETRLAVRNTGVSSATNVSATTDSEVVDVAYEDADTLAPTEWHNGSIDVDVPGGTPVGSYTANVTVTAEGTTGQVSETVQVRVDVLPTVRWEATTTDRRTHLSTTTAVDVNVTVRNDESSNVPLRDVQPVVDGNVTRLNVTPPQFVESLDRGEQTTLTTTVAVPEEGIQEGSYDGTVNVEPLTRYGRHFEYPVDVDDDYVVPAPENASVDVSVEAHGPSVDASAEFHPERQVAMRQGASTQRVTVDVVDNTHDVPTEQIHVRSEIPDGWSYKGNNPQKQTKVWIVEGTKHDTPSGHAGKRVKLGSDEFDVDIDEGTVVLEIDDVAATSFGRHMSPSDALEFEFRLGKDRQASEYGYTAPVDVATTSPVGVGRLDTPVAAIDVFDPRDGHTPGPRAAVPDRVPRGAVTLNEDANGTEATLVAEEYYRFQSDDQELDWLRFSLVANDTDQTVSTVFLPVNRSNRSVEVPVRRIRDDGAVVLPGVVSNNLRGAISSELRNGAPVDLVLDRARATRPHDSLSVAANQSHVQLVSDDESIRVGVSERPDPTDPDVRIPVRVGPSVFDSPKARGRARSAPKS
ncbi:hypothetical protein HARCEL1_03685 [Halococcoides cellulosivorans]|uniref:Uncharacterized protein n=1 Tax=Halococcoides cellulosivorans TaxID=1679096 RepID=A0A2R4WZA8_9EURY|nr:hypothetical protein HARCEL1_03685 [Halococcoides cellulosivorans]